MCYFSCFLCRSALLLSCKSRKEYYHSLVEKTKEKNTDRQQMETSRTDNIDKAKLSDTDKREPESQSSKEKLSVYLVGKILKTVYFICQILMNKVVFPPA